MLDRGQPLVHHEMADTMIAGSFVCYGRVAV
jgi:hypothetical protein